jgi:hypothetical protein
LNIRVPECEILVATHAVKNFIRNRDFFKIISAIETGADHGMWGFQRYCKWLETRNNLFVPGQGSELPDSEPAEATFVAAPLPSAVAAPRTEKKSRISPPAPGAKEGHRIEIEPVEGEFGKILKRPE